MTPKTKTDEELQKQWRNSKHFGQTPYHNWKLGYEDCQCELLPIIEQKDKQIRELEGIIERASIASDLHFGDLAVTKILSEAKKDGGL